MESSKSYRAQLDRSLIRELPWASNGPFLEHAFSNDFCSQILDSTKSGEWQERSYQGRVDTSQRNSQYIHLEAQFHKPILLWVKSVVPKLFGVEVRNTLVTPIIYRYPRGVGFKMHHDEVTEIEIKRAKKAGYPIIGGDLTFILFLNRYDEFEGGEIQFANHSLHRTPDIGDILFFPATRNFPHMVTKIESAIRYTAVFRAFIPLPEE